MIRSLVDTSWLAQHDNDPNVRIVEINRDDLDDYHSGHIPGAIGWNWKDMLWDNRERQFPSSRLFAERLGQAGIKNETTVVLCGVPVQFGTYGWWVFKYLGHNDVRLLNGGMTLWMQENRPLTCEVPSITPVEYRPDVVNESMRAGRDDILRELDSANTTIIDHRSAEENTGDRVAPPDMADVGAERHGRIPGAVHLPYTSFLNEDDTFKSPSELCALVTPVIGVEDGSAISYCRLSHRATLAYFAMTEILGYRKLSSTLYKICSRPRPENLVCGDFVQSFLEG